MFKKIEKLIIKNNLFESPEQIKFIKRNDKKIFNEIYNKIANNEEYALWFFMNNYKIIFAFMFDYEKIYSSEKDVYGLKQYTYSSFGLFIKFDPFEHVILTIKINNNEKLKINAVNNYIKQKEKGFYVKDDFKQILSFYKEKNKKDSFLMEFEYLIKNKCQNCKFYSVCEKGQKCKLDFDKIKGE